MLSVKGRWGRGFSVQGVWGGGSSVACLGGVEVRGQNGFRNLM